MLCIPAIMLESSPSRKYRRVLPSGIIEQQPEISGVAILSGASILRRRVVMPVLILAGRVRLAIAKRPGAKRSGQAVYTSHRTCAPFALVVMLVLPN